ncbi:MAG: hypothetical protein QQN41_07115 [Nitrosopumilus sp.]
MKEAVLTKGEKFGNLLVLDDSLKKTHGGKRRTSCYCLCDCGIKKWIRQGSLLCGDTKSCGCMKSKMISEKARKRTGPRVDRSGQKFGILTVTTEWRREQSGQAYVTKWKCCCECGVEKWIQTSVLSRTKSCGCLHRQNASKQLKLKPGQAAFNRVFQQYKLRAKRKQLDFKITAEDFKNITKLNCHYCRALASNLYIAEGRNGKFRYNGIDRKDNKLGYTLDNTVSCCKTCNRAKGELSVVEFLKWIQNVSLVSGGE